MMPNKRVYQAWSFSLGPFHLTRIGPCRNRPTARRCRRRQGSGSGPRRGRWNQRAKPSRVEPANHLDVLKLSLNVRVPLCIFYAGLNSCMQNGQGCVMANAFFWRLEKENPPVRECLVALFHASRSLTLFFLWPATPLGQFDQSCWQLKMYEKTL